MSKYYTGWVECVEGYPGSQFMIEGGKYFIDNGLFIREDGHSNAARIESIEQFNRGYKTKIKPIRETKYYTYDFEENAMSYKECTEPDSIKALEPIFSIYNEDTVKYLDAHQTIEHTSLFKAKEYVSRQISAYIELLKSDLSCENMNCCDCVLVHLFDSDDFRCRHMRRHEQDKITIMIESLITYREQMMQDENPKGMNKNKKEMKDMENSQNIVMGILDTIIEKDALVFTHCGIGVADGQGRVLVYNNGQMTTMRENMSIDKADLFVLLPSTINRLKEGDLIFQNNEYFFVKDIGSNIVTINVETGKLETLIPTVDIFGNSTYTKVYSAIDILGGYSFLKKYDSKYIAIVSALYKNRNNLEKYIKENGVEIIAPFVLSGNFLPKENKKFAMVLAAAGLLMVNTSDGGKLSSGFIKNIMQKKATKKQIVMMVAMIAVGIGTVGYKKQWHKKIKTFVKFSRVRDSFLAVATKIKNIFKGGE